MKVDNLHGLLASSHRIANPGLNQRSQCNLTDYATQPNPFSMGFGDSDLDFNPGRLRGDDGPIKFATVIGATGGESVCGSRHG